MGWLHGRGEEEAAWDATPEGAAQQLPLVAVCCDCGRTDVPASTLPEITADTN